MFEPIIPTRGIRQGNPLSPYIFILCAEGFSYLLHRHESMGALHGCKVARKAPVIFSLLFADDRMVCFRATEVETKTIHDILYTYGQASGLEINHQKSAVMFSTNTPLIVRRRVCNILQIKEVAQQFKYLGLPLWIGRKQRVTFNFIRDKVWECLQSWNSNFLSRACKEILIKSVIQAIINYCMSVCTFCHGGYVMNWNG